MSPLVGHRGPAMVGRTFALTLHSQTIDARSSGAGTTTSGTRSVGDLLITTYLNDLSSTPGSVTGYSTGAAGSSGSIGRGVYDRIATNTSGDDFTATAGPGSDAGRVIYALQFGFTPTRTYDTSSVGVAGNTTTASNTITVPAVTAPSPGFDLIFIHRFAGSSPTMGLTTPTGYTQVVKATQSVLSGNSQIQAALYSRVVTSGSTGTTNVDFTDSNPGTNITYWGMRVVVS